MAVDERVVLLDGCSGDGDDGGSIGCTWEEFTRVMEGSLNCDLDAVCTVTPANHTPAPPNLAPVAPPPAPLGPTFPPGE